MSHVCQCVYVCEYVLFKQNMDLYIIKGSGKGGGGASKIRCIIKSVFIKLRQTSPYSIFVASSYGYWVVFRSYLC